MRWGRRGRTPGGDPTTTTSPSAAEGAPPLLEVEHLSAGYGDLRAVWDISLTVRPGHVTALLGPNGAGKSTTVLAIGGLATTFGGSVRCGGVDMARLPPHERVVTGKIGLVQEGKRIFRRRTVDQNLRIGWWPRRHEDRRGLADALEAAYAQFPMLGERRHVRAGLLSGGQQQMLAIAQALMPGPRLLILDEPSAGLAPVVMGEVLERVGALCREGLGVLLVEQLVDAALSVADELVVINAGRVAASGTPDAVGGRDGVRKAYLDATLGPASPRPTGAPLMP